MKLFCKLFLLIFVFSTTACKNSEEKSARADKIVQKAIEKAGGDTYKNAMISFNFRGGLYKSVRKCGHYTFYSIQQDSAGNKLQNVLSNDGFKHLVNGKEQKVADSTAKRLSNALNSVHYFLQLPFGLDASAVHKQYAGTEKIHGKSYDKIAVSFAKKGGGKDYDDHYMYWISQKNKTIDYFAYSYEVNGGGMRFREAYNPRTIHGIRFVDYKNYAPKDFKSVELGALGKLFEAGKLQLFSKIENKNIKVSVTEADCG